MEMNENKSSENKPQKRETKFTGKLDSDGNKIYEGDIVEIFSKLTDVPDGRLVMEVIYSKSTASVFPFDDFKPYESHVIGNRFDKSIKFNGTNYTAIEVPYIEDENDCSRCDLCHEDCCINACDALCDLFDDYDPLISVVLKKK